MIYKKEYLLAQSVEQEHTGNNQTLLSAVAILEEVTANADSEGKLPAHTRAYIEEKFTVIRRAIGQLPLEPCKHERARENLRKFKRRD